MLHLDVKGHVNILNSCCFLNFRETSSDSVGFFSYMEESSSREKGISDILLIGM